MREDVSVTHIWLAEDVKHSALIGLFIQENSGREELNSLGGHIEYYLLTVVSKGSSKICFFANLCEAVVSTWNKDECPKRLLIQNQAMDEDERRRKLEAGRAKVCC